MPTAKDVKVFVPAQDFKLSLAFYQALGWKMNWQAPGLAELELGASRFFLQDYYHKDWAENFMLYVVVDNTQAWYTHISSVLKSGAFPDARVQAPKKEAHATVTYAWDPSGVLLHFAEDK